MKRLVKGISIVLLFSLMVRVNADIKCDDGKPGDTVNCTITNTGYAGSIKKISVDSGLKFVSCDVCDDTQYSIEANKAANFKFKIDDSIKEAKKLKVSFGGESSTISVLVEGTAEEGTEEEEDSDETIYSVTLVPGNNKSNKTLTCTVNSLNSTCNVTLEDIDDQNFTGWGKEKGCTEGATGSIKVNKNITYYACYKSTEETENPETEELNRNLLLSSLVVKNGDEEIDLGFSIRIFDYSIVVPTSVNSLNLEAKAQDETIDVVVSGNEKLEKEENVITITLTAEDGTKNEYKLNVVKSDETKLPLLSSLVVGGYNLGFNPEKFVYTLSIDSGITSLTVSAEPEKESYEYSITGQNDVKDGSKISVTVIDPESNAESTYVINIEQATSNLIIYIAIGGIVLVILIILLIIVVKKGKKANKNDNGTGTSNKSVNKSKGKVVKANIPEVKSTIPTAPVAPVTPVAPINQPSVKPVEEKKEDIEVLDF